MGGPPPDVVGPPGNGPVSNGHHGTPAPSGIPMSPAVRAGKEKMDNLIGQLGSANENTWMLIGTCTCEVVRGGHSLTVQGP